MSPSSTRVDLVRMGAAARLRLIPPEGKPPTLDPTVLDALDEALARVEADPPRLLVVESASAKYFCVGANLHALRETTEASIVPWVRCGHQVVNRLEDLPCPTVARVTGFALGGGLELALGCDLIFATPEARFGLPEATLGFIPGWGGCRRLAERIGTAPAKRWFFSAAVMDGVAARDAGLADFAGTEAEVDAELNRFGEAVEACSAPALAAFKRILGDEQREARVRNLEAEAAASPDCVRNPDTRRRLDAFFAAKRS